MSERLSPEAIAAFVASASPEVQMLARAVRARLLEVFPDAIETAEGRDFGYGFDRGYKGLVFTISLKKHGVNLGVFGGGALADPDGLLRGTGKLHRHVDVADPAVLDDPRLLTLLEEALAKRRPNH